MATNWFSRLLLPHRRLFTSSAAVTAVAKRGYVTSGPGFDAEYGKEHITPGIGRLTTVVFRRGSGSWLEAVDGTRYLDFTSGIGVVSTGHCHPKVTLAAQEQVGKLIHGQVNIGFHEPMLSLISRIKPYLPPPLDTFFFWNSGAEAVEASIKVARQATNKPNIIVFQGSYHGRTYGTMPLTTSKTVYRERFGPHMPGVFVAPFPYASQLPPSLTQEESIEYCLDQTELLLKQQTAPSETAAMLIEPVLGEGGYVVAPPAFLQGLRRICDREGILLLFDEVQSGYGRTGSMFALEHSGVVPDVLVMAKGLASGFPLSAIVARREIMAKQQAGSMGGTYAGNAVSCAAAIATLDVFEQDKLLANVVARGTELRTGLEALKREGFPIADVRGLGLMVGVELSSSCAKGTASRITQILAQEQRMLLMTCSIFEVLRFIPPLTVTADEIELAIKKFRFALEVLFPKK